MAIESEGPSRPLTETERNWLLATLMLIGCIALFGGIYAGEMQAGRWKASLRLVGEPAEATMRFLGISHFLVALFYTFSSKSMRSWRSWISFGAMLLIGGVLCGGFAWMRSFSPLVASGLFISYFLVHDFRDQVFFYFTNQDAGTGDRRALGGVLFWTPLCAGSLLAALVAALMILEVPGSERALRSLGALPRSWWWATVAVPALLAVVAFLRIRRYSAQAGIRSLAAHLRTHRPMHVVFCGSLSVLIVGIALGWRGYAIVILHVTAWYVFSWRQLAGRSGATASRPNPYQRLRGTVGGFNLLHIGSAIALMLIGLVWAYGFRGDPGIRPLAVLLDPANFPLWTILHVTASFRPR